MAHLTNCNSARHLPLLQADALAVADELAQHRPRHRLVLAQALEITVLKFNNRWRLMLIESEFLQ